jgi:hypothetical protein
MTLSPASLWGPVQVGASAAALYTVPASGLAVIRRAPFNNTSSGPMTLTVWVVRSGGSTGNGTQIFSRTVSAGLTDLAPELAGMTLGPGDSVWAQASSGATITSTASGFTQ